MSFMSQSFMETNAALQRDISQDERAQGQNTEYHHAFDAMLQKERLDQRKANNERPAGRPGQEGRRTGERAGRQAGGRTDGRATGRPGGRWSVGRGTGGQPGGLETQPSSLWNTHFLALEHTLLPVAHRAKLAP